MWKSTGRRIKKELKMDKDFTKEASTCAENAAASSYVHRAFFVRCLTGSWQSRSNGTGYRG
jgi:hypothetical protein